MRGNSASCKNIILVVLDICADCPSHYLEFLEVFIYALLLTSRKAQGSPVNGTKQLNVFVFKSTAFYISNRPI